MSLPDLGNSGYRVPRHTVLASIACVALMSCAQEKLEPGPGFPEALVQDQTLNIQVRRDVSGISLTNTTARDLPAGTMWLNKWYSHEFADGLGVGQSAAFELDEFVDEFGEAFRGGGFFATVDPDDLVLAQYQTLDDAGERVMYGFIVINGEAR